MTEHVFLIVDDEPVIRAYLKTILEKTKGVQSLEANDAVSALRIMGKLGGQIDLVITDVNMPGDMDGLDLAYSLRRSFPKLPIIVISGYSDIPPIPTEFPFIRKPFLPDTLREVIDRLLASPGDGRAAAQASSTDNCRDDPSPKSLKTLLLCRPSV